MVRLLGGVLLFFTVLPVCAQETKPSSHSATRAKTPILDAGAIGNGVYRNPSFGFSYKIPFGWVDRTAGMQDDSAEASKSRVLLATFERPPQATGDSINSAVVVAAEPLAGGMTSAVQYFESLAALITAKGFQATRDPQDVSLGTTTLVRGDFSMARGKLIMHQASLVVVKKGYAVSFTFIGGREDELNELIEKLSFAAQKTQH
jgi:hypothetical protein